MTRIRITAAGPSAQDEMRSLQAWLLDTPELRGRVTGAQSPPPSGSLGPVLEAVLVALGPGGAVAATAAAVVAWLRHRTADVTIEIKLPDGAELRVSAARVRKLTTAEIPDEVDRLVEVLKGLPAEAPPS